MTTELILLCLAAFAAGFIDAIVGGGGLIQTPAGLVLLPRFPVATVIGILKIPAFCGTALASVQYMQKVKIKWRLMILEINDINDSACFYFSSGRIIFIKRS